MSKYHCIERTLDIDHGPANIRLWLNQDVLPIYGDRQLALEVKALLEAGEDVEVLCAQLAELPNINAFQLRWNGILHPEVQHGLMVYTVPF